MDRVWSPGLLLGLLVSAVGLAAQPAAGVAAETKILTAEQIAFQLSQQLPSVRKGLIPSEGTGLSTVTFEYNSDRLTPQARQQLDELAKALSFDAFKGLPFQVAGHTDATGGEAYNQGLSERRALSVKVYLVDNDHLDAGKIKPTGYGESRPDPHFPPTAPEQRRVEILFLAGK